MSSQDNENIVKLYPKNAANNPDNVLELVVGEYESVFVLGYNKEGALDARGTTNLTLRDILWMLEVFKARMMSGCFSEEDRT